MRGEAQGPWLLGVGGEKERVLVLTVQRGWRLYLQEVLLGLCRLQGCRLGAGEAGVQHRLPHQQDRGRGAAAGAVHVCIRKHGLALCILDLLSSPADL